MSFPANSASAPADIELELDEELRILVAAGDNPSPKSRADLVTSARNGRILDCKAPWVLICSCLNAKRVQLGWGINSRAPKLGVTFTTISISADMVDNASLRAFCGSSARPIALLQNSRCHVGFGVVVGYSSVGAQPPEVIVAVHSMRRL